MNVRPENSALGVPVEMFVGDPLAGRPTRRDHGGPDGAAFPAPAAGQTAANVSTQPPDRPTDQLRPSPPPRVEERAVAPGGDLNVFLARLEDTVDSLRTGLIVVGLVAVVALGVSLYGLLTGDDGSSSGASRSGLASDARVSGLEDRVDKLSRQLQDVRSASRDNSELGDRVEQLEGTVKTLSESSGGDDAKQAVDQLSSRIDAIEKDVDALKQAPTP